MQRRPDQVWSYLDEGLPEQVGDALFMVEHPITTAVREGKRGVPDPNLIPWLAENKYVWITKDDEAKRDHLDDIIKHQISSIWVRGLDRKKNKISVRQLHLMLTVKLPDMEEQVAKARGPRHFLLYLKAGKVPVLAPLDIVGLRKKVERRRARGL